MNDKNIPRITDFFVDDSPNKPKATDPPKRQPSPTNTLHPELRPGEMFHAYRLPWSWYHVAASLPGKALAVGLLIWWEVTVIKRPTIRFSYLKARALNSSDQTIRNAIKNLEVAGLVEVDRGPGNSPRITLKQAPDDAPKQPRSIHDTRVIRPGRSDQR